MFTRIAVLFSIIAVLIGIWFTIPASFTPAKVSKQFANTAEADSQLVAYQKKTRKHTYDRTYDLSFQKNEITDDANARLPETATIPTNTSGSIAVNAENKYTADTQYVDTETLKKSLDNQSPLSLEDDHANLVPKIAYKPDKVVKASTLKGDKQTKALSISSPGSLVGFQTSNIENGTSGVSVDQSFVFSFSIVPSDAVLDKLIFSPSVPFTKSLSGNVLTVKPDRMDRATKYAFGFPTNIWPCKQGLSYLCEEKSNWSYRFVFQTDYKETLIYGQSEQGRDLVAKIYGHCIDQTTCKKIMLTGGIHGSEWRSGDLTQLQNYIEQNPQEIINKNKIITIVPFTNPDGTALNIRYNARNVNLNRNFPGNYVNCDICGAGALSEKESKYLVDLTLKIRPDVLISYHAQWPPDGIIFRGDDNNQDTIKFAEWVSQRTGYPVGVFPDLPSVPGDQTIWAESQGVRSLLIEATLVSNSDWSKNFNLYLALLRDY